MTSGGGPQPPVNRRSIRYRRATSCCCRPPVNPAGDAQQAASTCGRLWRHFRFDPTTDVIKSGRHPVPRPLALVSASDSAHARRPVHVRRSSTCLDSSLFSLLQRITLARHTRPDRGANSRRARERGYDPPSRSGGVFEPHTLRGGRAALLQISFVSFGTVITPHRRIIWSARAHTEQQGRNDQADTERLHASDDSLHLCSRRGGRTLRWPSHCQQPFVLHAKAGMTIS